MDSIEKYLQHIRDSLELIQATILIKVNMVKDEMLSKVEPLVQLTLKDL